MRVSVIVTAFLVLVTVFSIYTVVYSQGLPTTLTSTQVDSTYLLHGSYDYVAMLSPNSLYNTTVLGMGDGGLFSSITKSMNVTFTMTLYSSALADATLDSSYRATLSGGAWKTTLDQAANETQMNSANSLVVSKTFDFNITMIQQLIMSLQAELKYTAPQYIIKVSPVINGSLSASGQTVNLRFLAPLNVTMSGGVISLSSTDFTQKGNFTSIEIVSDPGNIRLQTESHDAFYVAIIATCASGVSVAITGRRKKQSGAEELEVATRPYREIIAASKSPPEGERQIVMQAWEDLVKVADTLGKPILEFVETKPGGEERHLFYVPEGDACYVYAFEAKPKEEPEGKPESESSPTVVAGGQQPLGDDLGDVSDDESPSG